MKCQGCEDYAVQGGIVALVVIVLSLAAVAGFVFHCEHGDAASRVFGIVVTCFVLRSMVI